MGAGDRRLSTRGEVAQLVEQWTENPRVPGSIPGLATILLFLSFSQFRQKIISLKLKESVVGPQGILSCLWDSS